jgi:hypothetical protein
MFIWSPRTPAGGGSPGFIGSYLAQAAAVEYGPAATVGRDLDRPESRQENYYETVNTGTQKSYSYNDLTGELVLLGVNESTQTTVQNQESIIYYPKN